MFPISFVKMKSIFGLLILVVSFADSYKILGVFPYGSKSHYTVGETVMKTLHEAGHEVTMISFYELSKPLPKYKQITVSDFMKTLEEGQFLRDKLVSSFSNETVFIRRKPEV